MRLPHARLATAVAAGSTSRPAATVLLALGLTGVAALGFAAPANAATCYPPGACAGATVTASTQVVTANGQLTLTYTGLQAGSSLTLVLHSAPVNLGTFTANSAGVVVATVTIPAGFSGTHTIVASGTSKSGAPITFTSTITIVPQSAGATGGTTKGGLPFTGANTEAAGAAGIALVVAGAAAVVVGRRRRYATS